MITKPIDYSPSDFDPREEAPQVRVSSWLPIDLWPVLRGEYVAPAPTVFERTDGVAFFYPYSINSLIGESGCGKTWMAAIAVTQQLDRGHHVIFIDYEGSFVSIVERLQALGASVEQIGERFSYIQPDVKFGELEQVLLFEECLNDRGKPSLVIIDGVTEAMAQASLNPNEGVDVATYFANAPRWFARHGAAVCLIDHVTKSSDTRGRYAIGSERKISGIDGAAYMVDLLAPFGRGKTGRVKLSVSKDRGGHVDEHANTTRVVAEVVLRSSPDGSITTTVEAPKTSSAVNSAPTYIMENISKMIESQPGIGSNQLRSVIKSSRENLATAIELLSSGGFIEIKPGPNRTHLHTSLKPFRAVDGGSQDDNY